MKSDSTKPTRPPQPGEDGGRLGAGVHDPRRARTVARRLCRFLAGCRLHRRPTCLLIVAGCICWASYLAVAVLSREFIYGRDHAERPILSVLGLLGLAFAWYLAGVWAAVRGPDNRRLLALILGFGVLFRITLLFSSPIQEIDIYRYLWDGAAAARGISPFQYSPRQVLDAAPGEALPGDLRRLVELRDSSPPLWEILSRVHYAELPTVYPPVSQAVFAVCGLITPAEATVFQRVVIMKAFFVSFDLGTLVVVICLLRLAGRHRGWSAAYGWCPLVIKEFANSGHLDAVAVFLTALAVLTGLYVISRRTDRHATGGAGAAVLLGLAVGAKLYPVVLAPLFGLTWLRRFGWRATVIPGVLFGAVVAAVLWPMLPAARTDPLQAENRAPGESAAVDSQDPSSGLKAFLGSWEMNDFLFLLVVENLKPDGDGAAEAGPWFVAAPNSWRSRLVVGVSRQLGVTPSAGAFLLARLVTGAVFLGLALSWAWRAAGPSGPNEWLRAAFLTVAWFWLLSPTQNPWYWTWALPFVAFARGRAWLIPGGLSLIYYLRFWLGYHWADEAVPGSCYRGEVFFDYVVTWIEFGPWFVCLALAWLQARRGPAGAAGDDRARLVIFTRYPQPGKVKTRLNPALGEERAADLHEALARHTLGWAGELAAAEAVSVEVHFAGGSRKLMRARFGADFHYIPQPGGDLGERMAGAFARSFDSGVGRTVIVGTDCPGLSADIVADALEKLRTDDLVLGPATDGGYYLIGLSGRAPGLFTAIDWGTERVLAATLARAESLELTVSLLEQLPDVDRPEDLGDWLDPVWVDTRGEPGKDIPDCSAVEKISVVIPTLNDEDELGAAIHGAGRGVNVETIVAAAGGRRSTRDIARSHGVQMIEVSQGRARQMNAGAAVAAGSILVFLHADTRLPEGFDRQIRRALARPGVSAGAFRLRIDGRGWALRVIERAVDFRSKYRQAPYGDQAIFLRADTFRELGGFAELPIMEDYDLVRRLRGRGRIAIVPAGVVTSARRWQELGPWRTTWINQMVILGYRLGVSPERLGDWYNRKRGR